MSATTDALSTFTTTWSRSPRQVRKPAVLRDIQKMFDDALQCHLAGRLEDAVARYRKVLALRPDFVDAHNNLGLVFATQGRLDDALARYKRALFLKPDSAGTHLNLGAVLMEKGMIVAAMAHYESVLALNPNHAGAHYSLGIALVAQGKVDEAVLRYKRALVLNPDFADAHNNLGGSLAALGNSDEAMTHYRRAIAINPNHAEAHNNLGTILREQGRFDDALEHYGRTVAINPDQVEAHYHRAEIRFFRQGDRELAALEALAARNSLPANKAPFVHFALAKALDDTGDYGRAFEHLRKGNDSKRRQIHYDEPAVVKTFKRVASVCDRLLLERVQGEGDPSTVPIFVVGMPRSGSSLLEQILASHPQIHGAGELPALERASRGSGSLRRIGEDYLARLPVLANGQIRIVDKQPDNFLRIGLIRLILPNARIIHTVRDPLDTCLSCYSKLFTAGQNYSYDMAELGRYYRRYQALMAHWKVALPSGAMLDVAYEDVVDDLEGQARRLIDYCGLPWDDRCLSFYKTNRPVKTASAVQVRQLLFRSSLQRWRKYETCIGPLMEELGSGRMSARAA